MPKRNPKLFWDAYLERTYVERKYQAEKANIWRAISEFLNKPRRRIITVNLSRITRYVEKGKIVVVPGKVLGAGNIDSPITVAALNFTDQAERKIKGRGGKCLQLKDIIEGDFNPSQLVIVV